jgi:hypothetical protein
MNTMSNLLTADDIIPQESALREMAERLDYRAYRGSRNVSFYGANPIDLHQLAVNEMTRPMTLDLLKLKHRWELARHKHVEYIINNPQLLLNLFNSRSIATIRRAGVESVWTPDEADFFKLTLDGVAKVLGDKFKVRSGIESESFFGYRYMTIMPADERVWAGADDGVEPTLINAKWKVLNQRWHAISMSSNIHSASATVPDSKGKTRRFRILYATDNLSVSFLSSLVQMREAFERPIDISDLQSARVELYRATVAAAPSTGKTPRELDNQFRVYWSKMKEQMRVKSQPIALALDDFKTIPLLDWGTATSRTWGIEVETMHAERTSRPAGWDSRYDGSLSGDRECECDCDDCYHDSHCGYDDCGNGDDSDCREFVSPVLDSFNSRGLQKLCTDIGMNGHNETPGIHVHVGAGDVTVADISRLLFAYSIVSPLIDGLYFRQTRNYCKDLPSELLRSWLSLVRKASVGNAPISPADVLRNGNVPRDRYVDVNLEALLAHGTIEFRAMGAHYDYEHLVRWAWLCREMVNVSKVDVPRSEWLACKSVADVVAILTKYGVEMTSPADMEAIGVGNWEE